MASSPRPRHRRRRRPPVDRDMLARQIYRELLRDCDLFSSVGSVPDMGRSDVRWADSDWGRTCVGVARGCDDPGCGAWDELAPAAAPAGSDAEDGTRAAPLESTPPHAPRATARSAHARWPSRASEAGIERLEMGSEVVGACTAGPPSPTVDEWAAFPTARGPREGGSRAAPAEPAEVRAQISGACLERQRQPTMPQEGDCHVGNIRTLSATMPAPPPRSPSSGAAPSRGCSAELSLLEGGLRVPNCTFASSAAYRQATSASLQTRQTRRLTMEFPSAGASAPGGATASAGALPAGSAAALDARRLSSSTPGGADQEGQPTARSSGGCEWMHRAEGSAQSLAPAASRGTAHPSLPQRVRSGPPTAGGASGCSAVPSRCADCSPAEPSPDAVSESSAAGGTRRVETRSVALCTDETWESMEAAEREKWERRLRRAAERLAAGRRAGCSPQPAQSGGPVPAPSPARCSPQVPRASGGQQRTAELAAPAPHAAGWVSPPAAPWVHAAPQLPPPAVSPLPALLVAACGAAVDLCPSPTPQQRPRVVEV
eukprot:TRINITY_DN20622_c0_g1_i1.p1 TRINITY_DN20622_c0_g1~~TRINITY_DN20622_c0_g1_i1.p1  ORF type:complete len:544 (+),score=46.18 TRINITY_DN20622_c0_g1_i1:69-1700(+)